MEDENTAPANVWVDDAVVREGADEDDLDVKQQRRSLSGNGVRSPPRRRVACGAGIRAMTTR